MSKQLAASFAQMLGIRPKSKGARAEDDEEKDKKAKGSRAEGDDEDAEDEGEDKKAKGSRAEDEDGDDADASRAEDDDEDAEDEDDDKKAKGARADDEEDDDAAEDEEGDEGDGDEKKDSKAKKAAKAERARCARIVSHGIKCGNVKQAGVFAFDTGMSSSAAIAALDAAASVSEKAPKASSLRDRMASANVQKPGSGSASTAQPDLAAQIIAAGKARRGEQ